MPVACRHCKIQVWVCGQAGFEVKEGKDFSAAPVGKAGEQRRYCICDWCFKAFWGNCFALRKDGFSDTPL